MSVHGVRKTNTVIIVRTEDTFRSGQQVGEKNNIYATSDEVTLVPNLMNTEVH